jgi:hypothetical protein
MFDHLFENRNTTVTNLLKLGDCLGRSLRENVELFSIDSENKEVAYLTESGKVLSGKYDFSHDVAFNEIKIQESEIFLNNETFDSYVTDKVSSFVGNINEDNYREADGSFTDILSLWENRLKFENVKKRLEEKICLFSENQNIIKTEQFQQFLEIMPQFMDFLTENKNTIQTVQEIENAIKLSNSVSQAFNFPKLSYETLGEQNSYIISRGLDKSIYELICKQELVKKELFESKKNFEDVWATNPKIRQLAGLIFEDSDEEILQTLVEAVVEIPYLALTTKKQLLESIRNAFSLSDETVVSSKDLKSYVSKLFEMKKPLKSVIIELLNTKYGINVQNLKETATFEGLTNTQVVIFEALTRLAPKGSVVRDTLSNVGSMLKTKNGVEAIDVNELLQECFEACQYSTFCEDFKLVEGLSFENILDEEVSITELVEKAKKRLLFDKKKKNNDSEGAPEEDNLSTKQQQSKKEAEEHENHPSSESDEEDDSVRAAERKPKKKNGDDDDDEEEDPVGDIEDVVGDGASVKKQREAIEAKTEEPPTEAPEEGGKEPQEEKPLTKEEFLDTLKDMEELLQGISPEDEEEKVDTAETDEEEA